MLSINHPGLSFEAFGWVQMRNLNCIFSETAIPSSEERVKLLLTQPLWDEDAKTDTGELAPIGIGASVDIVLG